MRKLQVWLLKEMSLLSLLYVIPLYILCDLTYSFGALKLIHIFYPVTPKEYCSNTATMAQILKYSSLDIIGCAGLEEALCRLMPFAVMNLILIQGLKGKQKVIATLFCLIVSSIVFGLLHGNYINIFTQGVSGVFFSFIYLKYGGYLNNAPLKGWLSSTLAHGFFNLTIIKIYLLTH